MLKDFKPVVKNKNFVYIWISQIFSQLTINIMNFVLLIKLFEVTGSAISTSMLWVAYSLPAILIGPVASALTDMWDKRKILIFANLLQCLTIFVFALASRSSIFLLYGVVFIYSFINQFYVPSEISTIPTVLKKDNLAHGNSLFFITQQSAMVLGFALAGLLNSSFGFTNTLYICSAFLFIAFISTLFLPKLQVIDSVSKDFEGAIFGFFKHIKDGYDFIKGERKVLTPVLLLIGFQVALQIVIVQFPTLAKNVLLIPLNHAGLYILVPAGIGAVIGALIIPKIVKQGMRKKKIIDTALLGLGITLLLLIYAVPMFNGITRFVLSFVMIASMGFGFVSIIVPSQTFLQESTPAELRGRVFGNFTFLVIIASVLPIVFSGSVVEIFGIKTLLLILSLFIFSVFAISKKFGSKFIAG